jgi:hypothetical protein
MGRSLSFARSLHGYRGRPRVATAALEDLLLRVAQLSATPLDAGAATAP